METALSHRLLLRSIATAVVCAALLLAPVTAQRSSQEAPDDAVADQLFDASQLHDIWIHIHTRDWEQLRTAHQDSTYYPADIEWRGLKVRNAGIRARGRTSRNPYKPSLRVDFNRYVSGQEFLGLKSLALDNLYQDPSMIRERLAMQVFERMGIPAPRESHARVFVGADRQFAGVYGVVEAIDKAFLERTLDDDAGYLYEYQWQDPFGFQMPRGDLQWYAARFEPKTRENAGMAALFGPIHDLVQTINDAPASRIEQALAPHLDLQTYIRQIAIENFLSEPDGLLGNLGMSNFYLYRSRDTNAFRMIPWDKDLSFESLETPAPWNNFDSNVLASKIRAEPGLSRAYLTALLDVAAAVGPPADTPAVADPSGRQCPAPEPEPPCGWLEGEVFRQYAQIRDAALADSLHPYSDEAFEGSIEFLKRFARERSALVREHVAQQEPALAAAHGRMVSDRFQTRNRRAR